MKYLLTAIIVFTCFLSKAQTASDKICGVWKLSESVYDGELSDSSTNSNSRYKIITPAYFTVIDIDSKTNVTKTNIFGTYTLDNGTYKENITNVTADSADMIGQKFSFIITFNGDDKFSQLGSFNGMEVQEKWVRVLSKN